MFSHSAAPEAAAIPHHRQQQHQPRFTFYPSRSAYGVVTPDAHPFFSADIPAASLSRHSTGIPGEYSHQNGLTARLQQIYQYYHGEGGSFSTRRDEHEQQLPVSSIGTGHVETSYTPSTNTPLLEGLWTEAQTLYKSFM